MTKPLSELIEESYGDGYDTTVEKEFDRMKSIAVMLAKACESVVKPYDVHYETNYEAICQCDISVAKKALTEARKILEAE